LCCRQKFCCQALGKAIPIRKEKNWKEKDWKEKERDWREICQAVRSVCCGKAI